MGLFSKLSKNMHGGVNVKVKAPSSIAADQVIPVDVLITSDQAHTVTNVKAELKAQARESGVGGMMTGNTTFGGDFNNNGVGVEENRTNYQTVAQAESRDSFEIGAGETKTVTLQLFLNGSSVNNTMPGQPVGGIIGGLMNVAQTLDHVNYLYEVHASANVQGVTFHPSDKMPIQLLPLNNAQPATTQNIDQQTSDGQDQSSQPK